MRYYILKRENIMSKRSFNSKQLDDKNKGTFLIKVNCNESGTWQGNVLWADENKTEHFRSGLELLNLIDSALDGGSLTKRATG